MDRILKGSPRRSMSVGSHLGSSGYAYVNRRRYCCGYFNPTVVTTLCLFVFFALDRVIETPYGWTILRKTFVGNQRNSFRVPCGWDYEASWKIGYAFGTSPENMSYAHPRSREPIITCGHVMTPATSFVADPFLVLPSIFHNATGFSRLAKSDTWYLFYELKNLDRTPAMGEIGVSSSSDQGFTWQYHGVVLSETFHLSFPNVIYDRQSNNLLMFPETSMANELRIYRTTPQQFPFGWEVHQTKFSGATGKQWVDTTMLFYRGEWWIWSTEKFSLHLFHAPSLDEPWIEHTQSPIYRNNRRLGRNGGSVIESNGVIYRFAQDCVLFYGKELVVLKIVKLDHGVYEEIEVDTIVHPGSPAAVRKALWPDTHIGANTLWNSERIHHINLHKIGAANFIAVTDGDDRIDKSFHMFREGWFDSIKLLFLGMLGCALAMKFFKLTKGGGTNVEERRREKYDRWLIIAVLLLLSVVLSTICNFFQRCFRPIMHF
eukprot:m.261780 g.261780  ORF g.261780 m.261780 type:complete len:488 (+) comp43124_c0_seq1:259-1722(+)